MLKRLFGELWGRVIAMIALLPVVALSILMAHQTAIGPLKDALWEELPGIKRVRDELKYTIPTPVPVILSWNHAVGEKELLFLHKYTEYLQNKLSGWKISSLMNYQTRAWDESWGEKMEQWSSYINPLLLVADGFSLETWKNQVVENPSVFGKYVDKQFQYFTILVGPPEEMNQFEAIREFRRVMQRNYPPKNGTWFQNIRYYANDYLDTDFVPYREDGWPEILVGSLSVTETLITWAFFVDVDIKILFGYFLLPTFLFIAFRDPEYALSVWLGTLFAFLAALASVWPLSLVGMHYSVFLLPTLVGGVMIASLSFNAQIMEDIKRCSGVRSCAEWKTKAESVKKSVKHIFRLTLICFAFFGFWYQSLWTAIVMDTVLAIGALWGLTTQIFFLPALYFFVKARAWHTPRFIARVADVFESWHARLMERKMQKFGSWHNGSIHTLFIISIMLAFVFVWSGRIDTNSRQIEFLGNTNAKTMLNRMAELGRLDVIPIYFERVGFSNDSLLDEKFFNIARAFLKELKQVKDVGVISSIIDQINYEMRRTDGLAVPFQEAVELTRFGAKESDLVAWTEWKNGVFVWVDHPMKDARGIDEATRQVEKIAWQFQQKHPWLHISLFGDNLHYAPLALITAGQAPWMLATSLLAIFLYYSWMVRQECKNIPAFKGGFVIAQPFLFVSAVVAIVMAVFSVPLNIATAVIIPIVIGAASDANIYPAQEFFSLLQKKNANGDEWQVAAEALRTRGKAVDIDCAGNMMVLGLLLLSSFTPVWHLGMLSCVALFASRWWSINFTLPQLLRMSILNLAVEPLRMEVKHENDPYLIHDDDCRRYANGDLWLP